MTHQKKKIWEIENFWIEFSTRVWNLKDDQHILSKGTKERRWIIKNY